MSEVKRYGFKIGSDGAPSPFEHPGGQWVDYRALEAAEARAVDEFNAGSKILGRALAAEARVRELEGVLEMALADKCGSEWRRVIDAPGSMWVMRAIRALSPAAPNTKEPK